MNKSRRKKIQDIKDKLLDLLTEIEELDALCEDEEGNKWEENSYMVMLHDKKGKMEFEEFLESDLKDANSINRKECE